MHLHTVVYESLQARFYSTQAKAATLATLGQPIYARS